MDSLVNFCDRNRWLGTVGSICIGRRVMGAAASGYWAMAIILVSSLSIALPTGAEEGDRRRSFGSPDAVGNQIENDERPARARTGGFELKSWSDWKASLQKSHSLSFGIDYSSQYFGADNSLGEDSASSGMVRFYGSWDLVGRDTKNAGSLVWKIENRHRYDDIPPKDLALGELGYVGLVGAPFNDEGGRLTNLYWLQRFNEGKTQVIGGYLDATDYVDVFVGGSPWTAFSNLVFSVGSASIFTPNDSTLGLAVASMITENVYTIASVSTAYADPTDPFDESFDRAFNENEYFKSLEIGWTNSSDRIYFDNTHLTFWHVDDSEIAGVQDGWGVAFSHISYIHDKWMPFLRGGYADDGGSLLEKSVSAGLMYQNDPDGDLIGLGLNWGEPNETTFAPDLDDQVSLEAFYRLQFTPRLAVTPSVEYIEDPALNPKHNSIWMAGLRMRFVL